MSSTNGTKTNNPKFIVAPTTIDLAQRIDRLERELAETRWCFAELHYAIRLAATRQLLQAVMAKPTDRADTPD